MIPEGCAPPRVAREVQSKVTNNATKTTDPDPKEATMRRTALVTATLMALLATACGGEPGDEFRDAVPTRDQLAMNVPGSAAGSTSSSEGVGALSRGLVGQRADLYTLTRDVSRDVNGSIWVGLNVIESIIQHPPTFVDKGVVTWGPHTPPLEPLTWMLNVKKAGPKTYNYVLSARHKTDLTGSFVPIIAGQSTRGYSATFSGYTGTYTANASALHALDPVTYRDTGKMIATYDTTGVRRKVEMALKDYSEDGGPMGDALYSYVDRLDTSGEFRFVARTDLHKNSSKAELFVTGTRWNASGAGRGDAVVTGGDLPSGIKVQLTECWNAGFARVFYTDNTSSSSTEGNPAACVFNTALK